MNKSKILINTKKAYSKIFNLINKHKDLCDFDIEYLLAKSEIHLFGIELKEVHGFNIEPKDIVSTDYVVLGNNIKILQMGKKHGRTISWSDDKKQPIDELMLLVTFPSGAYFFGSDYPIDLFNALFNELINLKPKFIDTHNSCLYYSITNAGVVYNQFDSICKKYIDLHNAESKNREIKKLEDQLNLLKNL